MGMRRWHQWQRMLLLIICSIIDAMVKIINARKDRLDEVGEGTVDGRAQRLDVLPEVDGGLGTLSDSLRGELEFLKVKGQLQVTYKVDKIQKITYRVHLLVRTRSTKSVETKLLVTVLLPTKSRHDLNRQRRNAIGKNR